MTTLKKYENLHKNNIKVVLDGVFNHVGRGFWAFQDVLQNRENSRYRDWFSLISTVIQITMMVFGTKAGRVISIL